MKKKLITKGFTLIEMLITIGVFAIVLMVVSSIFININNLQQNTGNLQRLQNEGRYILEKIAKEVRSRELDYQSMNFSSGGLTEQLNFKPDELGDSMSIVFNKDTNNIFITVNNVSETLNSYSVKIENLQFRVFPDYDPFSLMSTSSEVFQPRVTIYLKLSNKNVPEKYLKNLELQTTISSKIYK